MRRPMAVLAVLACFAVASTARAEGFDNLLYGLNSLLTFPADPVMETVNPPEEFESFALHQVTQPMAGLVTGFGLGFYRATMGLFDVVLSPFWVFPILSPEPRYAIIPGVESE